MPYDNINTASNIERKIEMKKNIWKRIAISLLAAVIAASALAGCGAPATSSAEPSQAPASPEGAAPAGEKTKVTFWTWTPTEDQFEQIKVAFEKAYPDVEIEWWRTAQMDDYLKKLQVAMAGGEGPDLFGLQPGAMLNQYSRFCEPMDQLADQYISGWKDAISPDAMTQAASLDGVQAGMPVITVGQQFMLYNKTLLAENGITEVPKTYEELLAVSDTLKAKDLLPMAFGAKDIWHDVDFFVSLSQQFGPGKIYEAEKGELAWTDQVFVDTMTAWKKLFDDKIFQDGALGVSTYPDARDQYFYARNTAMFPTGSWHVSVVIPNAETSGTKVEKDEIGMALFPQMGPNPAVSTTGVDFVLAVNKDSKNKEAAAKFVEHMVMGEGQQIWINTLQGSPVNKNIKFTGDSQITYDLAKQSIDYVNAANNASAGKRKLDYAELENALGIAMQDVASGKPIADALAEVQAVSEGITR